MTASVENLEGKRVGRLLVIRREESRGGFSMWLCQCDCGNDKLVAGVALARGSTKSCGCLRPGVNPSLQARDTKRSPQELKTYHCWYAMVKRCTDPKHPAWKNYGGRGITVCARWLDGWRNFMWDMGPVPDGLSIERIDNNAGYWCGHCDDCVTHGRFKLNCKWATRAEQTRNRRSVKLTHESLIEILRLEATGLPVGEIARQVRMGPNLTGAIITTAKLLREIEAER